MTDYIKDLETTASQEVAEISNPDFLQEKSEFVTTLQMRLRQAQADAPSAWENLTPSQIKEAKAKIHIEAFEQELERMRATGNYFIPVEKPDGTPIERDVQFLRAKSVLPEEIKKEFID